MAYRHFTDTPTNDFAAADSQSMRYRHSFIGSVGTVNGAVTEQSSSVIAE